MSLRRGLGVGAGVGLAARVSLDRLADADRNGAHGDRADGAVLRRATRARAPLGGLPGDADRDPVERDRLRARSARGGAAGKGRRTTMGTIAARRMNCAFAPAA